MKKYCRYCAYCFEADDYRCSNHPDGKKPHWTEKQIKRETECENFVLSDLGCIITGRQYKPRNNTKKYKTENNSFQQLNIFDDL